MKVENMTHNEEDTHSIGVDTWVTQIIITVKYVQVGGGKIEHVKQR